jgi:hypothetical protein
MRMFCFRDVVFVTAAEYELKRALDTVKKRIKNFYKFSETWVGITGNNRSCSRSINTMSAFQKWDTSTVS